MQRTGHCRRCQSRHQSLFIITWLLRTSSKSSCIDTDHNNRKARKPRGLFRPALMAILLLLLVVIMALLFAPSLPSFYPKSPAFNDKEGEEDVLCIVVPFRDGCSANSRGHNRTSQLHIFVQYITSHLKTSNPNLNFSIIIAEQEKVGYFNRGLISNRGVFEGRRLLGCSYFGLHDVDLLPISLQNTYANKQLPIVLATSLSSHNFQAHVRGSTYVTKGGALLVSYEQWQKANGYPNSMVGWGFEDDAFAVRLENAGFVLGRLPVAVGRYQDIHQNTTSKSSPVAPLNNIYWHNGRPLNQIVFFFQAQDFKIFGGAFNDVRYLWDISRNFLRESFVS